VVVFFTQAVGSIVNFIMVNTLAHFNGWVIKDLRVLGDDSCFKIVNRTCDINRHKLASQAWHCFGAILHPDKIKFTRSMNDRTFLGYKMHGYRFVRDTFEWFKMALYPEHDITSLEQSASRVLAYYILGGCNDQQYCSFFWDYWSRYPTLQNSTLVPTRGLRRMLKYVLRIDPKILICPDVSRLNLHFVSTSLSLNDPCFHE